MFTKEKLSDLTWNFRSKFRFFDYSTLAYFNEGITFLQTGNKSDCREAETIKFHFIFLQNNFIF